MAIDTSRWRSSSAYDYIDDLTPPQLAWECLRRNPDYQQDYARLAGRSQVSDAEREEVCRKWGLRFPDPT